MPDTPAQMLCRGRANPQSVYSATLALAFCAGGACAAGPPADPAPNRPVELIPADEAAQRVENRPPHRLPASLSRRVIQFDFEEAALAPIQMPRFFYRYGGTIEESETGSGARAEGFPPFGEMGLTDDAAFAGRWSFGFSLAGGSLSSRVPTHVIPVMPGATYEVTVHVRTAALTHARARLVCWLHDARGEEIEGTRTASEPVRTAGRWVRQAVRLPAAPEDASGLVIELQLVQPRHWQPTLVNEASPALEDIHGRAWFDSLAVTLLPRVECAVGGASGIVRLPDRPLARIAVNDATRAPLDALLEVFDLSEVRVIARELQITQANGELTVPLPIEQAGWYRLELTISEGGAPLERLSRNFVTCHDGVAGPQSGGSPFVVIDQVTLDRRGHDDDEAIAGFLGAMEPREVISRLDAASLDAADAAVDTAIAIESLIEHVDRMADLADGSSVWLEKLSAGDSRQSPGLDRLLTRHGLHARRWIVDEAIDEAGAALQRMAAASDVFSVAPIDHDPTSRDDGRRLIVRVPPAWPVEQIGPSLDPWLALHDVQAVMIESPESSPLPARQQAADAMIRALMVWRAGVNEVIVDRPWERRGESTQPSPLLPAWATLGRHLRHRVFLADLSPDEHTHCWLIGAPDGDDAALIVWSDAAGKSTEQSISMCAGGGAMIHIDHAGNEAPLQRTARRTTIPVSDLPAVIEGVDRRLLQFTALAAMSPDTMPPLPSMQEASLRLGNPWPRQISGTVRIASRDDLQILSHEIEFMLGPGETAELPVTVLPTHRVIAGRRTIQLDVTLAADQAYEFNLDLPLLVSMDDLSLTTGWRRIRTDTGERQIEITASVSNRGQTNRQLALIVLSAGGAMTRRALPDLPAGDTIVTRVQLPEGRIAITGDTLRIGLADRIGGAQFNQLLVVPPSSEFAAATTDEDP